ncbi:PilZ domain-containing protein [Sphingomonas sp. SUN019]|uniref:PilZ domain-containing protein n=1 Tax=Sphingomonas sp. SUN019 TaxID=2937788 RepID=UPI002164CD0A|nr:PilZ domain-containing protein [Sphingomonas sp. SUN019]UVO49547.1 PilZ domain-containing protein [Sphingomonas sp. SUN019]
MATAAATIWHDRSEPRDEVMHRARAVGPDGRHLSVTVVNVSPHGMMLRCDQDYPEGERLSVALPAIGIVTAVVRWSLGGRIGCQLERAIPANRYHQVLGAMA